MSVNCFRYLYCDEVKVTNENVNNLLYAAKKYAVKGLVDQCLKTLEASICVKNVCEILEQVRFLILPLIQGSLDLPKRPELPERPPKY